jgi:hypothetical protein
MATIPDLEDDGSFTDLRMRIAALVGDALKMNVINSDPELVDAISKLLEELDGFDETKARAKAEQLVDEIETIAAESRRRKKNRREAFSSGGLTRKTLIESDDDYEGTFPRDPKTFAALLRGPIVRRHLMEPEKRKKAANLVEEDEPSEMARKFASLRAKSVTL